MSIVPAGAERLLAPTQPASRTASQAIAARKLDEARSAARSLAANRFKPQDIAKQQARAKVQALVERVRILKKLYAGDPREMAHALAQVLKDLKAAVKAFSQATGEEFGMAGDVANDGGVGSADPAQPPPEGPGQGEDQKTAPAGDAGGREAEAVSPAQTPGVFAYTAAAQDVREGIGRDAADFAKSVRELARDLSDLLDTARAKARAARPDRQTDKAFEAADKAMHALHTELDGLERDVRLQAPTVGIKLSVAA